MLLTPEILSLDLASLRCVRLVYRYRSFALAAQELGMNPSSISYTIDRIRRAADDPLFVRQGGGIHPTQHCQTMMASVERILAEAEHLLDAESFDPAQTQVQLNLWISTFARMVLLAPLVRRLRKEAPGLKLTLDFGYRGARRALLEEHCDLAIVPESVEDSGIHRHAALFSDQHVCLMDPSHALAEKSSISIEDLATAKHLLFEPEPGWQQMPTRQALQQGVIFERMIASSDSRDLCLLVAGTDMVATLPSRMAWQWRDQLAIRPLAFEAPAVNHMYWSHTWHRSKLHSWLRGMFIEEASRLAPPLLRPAG